MNILDSQLESNTIDDIFIEICEPLGFEQLLELQLLSKYNGKIIRKTKWSHTNVGLYNTDNGDSKVIRLALTLFVTVYFGVMM